jgi:glycosyl transferase family 87
LTNRPSRFLRVVLFPFLAVHVLFFVMWFAALAGHGPAQGDWRELKIVADHFVAGDWSRLYAVGDQTLYPGYYWRYPPFALYVVAPLARLSDTWAYAVLIGVEAMALGASLWLLRRLEPFRRMRAEWLLAIVVSAPALTILVTGQSSGLIMLCVVGAATLWTNGRVIGACALLGLLAVKPNWGIVFGLMAIARREWKGAITMAAVAALLCVTTVPLGRQLWADFLGVSIGNSLALEGYDPQKHITLRGFLEGLVGTGDVTMSLWALAAVGLTVAAILAWRVPGPPLRHMGIAVLLAISANPYGFFYDALVLAIPGTVWWAERNQWARRQWLIVGILLAIAWCTEQWIYSWGVLLKTAGLQWMPPVSLVGPIAAVWLVLAARQTTEMATSTRELPSPGQEWPAGVLHHRGQAELRPGL